MRATSALLIIFSEIRYRSPAAPVGGQDQGAGGIVDADRLQLDTAA